MKKRIISFFLAFVLVIFQLPASAKAKTADKYGSRSIYVGWLYADYMAEQTLKQIPLRGKTTVQKIQAVYDWIEKNCRRSGNSSKTYFNIKAIKPQVMAFGKKSEAAYEHGDILKRRELSLYGRKYGDLSVCDSNMNINYFAMDMMLHRVGSCAGYSSLLALLLGHLGLDCHVIDGEFINSDGSGVMHKWNYVLVGGKYYWLDVRMDNANYAKSGRISHTYFMKTDNRSWAKRHSWLHSYTDVIAQSAAKTIAAYSKRVVLISKITLSKSDLSLNVGQTAKLTVKLSPSNATDKTIQWKSTDSKIASVKNGKITAIAVGTCFIEVIAGNNCLAYCKVTVTNPNTSSSSSETSSASSSSDTSSTDGL